MKSRMRQNKLYDHPSLIFVYHVDCDNLILYLYLCAPFTVIYMAPFWKTMVLVAWNFKVCCLSKAAKLVRCVYVFKFDEFPVGKKCSFILIGKMLRVSVHINKAE